MHSSSPAAVVTAHRLFVILLVGIGALTFAPVGVVAQATTIVSTPVDDLLATRSGSEVALDPEGSPVLAYLRTDGTPGQPGPPELRLARCADRGCSAIDPPQPIPVPLEDPSDNLKEMVDLVVTPDDTPVISVLAGRGLYIIRCLDPACRSSQTDRVPVDRYDIVSDLAVLPDGTVKQVLVAFDVINLVTCTDAGCALEASLPSDGTGYPLLGDLAIAADGSAIIAIYRPNTSALELWRCADGVCELQSTIAVPTVLSRQTIDDAGIGNNEVAGRLMDVGIDSRGSVLVAFASGELLFCEDPTCSDGDAQPVRPSPLARAEGKDVALMLGEGQRPTVVIDYNGPQDGSIRIYACIDDVCSAATENRLTTEQRLRRDRFYFDAVVGADDRPLVIYNRSIVEGFTPRQAVTLVTSWCANEICGATSTCDGFTVTVDLSEGQSPTAGPDVVLGTDDDDVIAAGGGDDVICGLAGNDTIWGQVGDDAIFGHDGDDKLRGGPGDDALLAGNGIDDAGGGPGVDLVEGGAGNDVALRGGTGNDTLRGDDGDDQLVNGNGGADLVFGNNGNDILLGGPRTDRLVGSRGNDLLKGNAGADRLEGGSGDDELLGGPGGDVLDGDVGDDLCNGGTSGPGSTEFDQVTRCESLVNVP